MSQRVKIVAFVANGLFIAVVLLTGMLYLAADVGPNEALKGFISLIILAMAAVVVIAALVAPRRIGSLSKIGYCVVCLFIGVAGWLWIENFNSYSQLSPPTETIFLSILSAINLWALVTNRPIQIVPLLQRRLVRNTLIGGLVIAVSVFALLAATFIPRISTQYESAEHFLRLGGGVRWHNGWVSGVYLKGTKTTDDDLHHLKDFPKLESLYLSNTQVTDAGLAHLSSHRPLAHLYLDETAVTDSGLRHISSLTKLQNLWLHRTQVSDSGLRHLEGMTDMGYLDLGYTKVTDEGLPHLYGMRRMYYLHLPGTAVTEAGLRKIGDAIPGLSAYNGTVSIGK